MTQDTPFTHLLAGFDFSTLAPPASPPPGAAPDPREDRRQLLVSIGVPLKHARLIAFGALDETPAVVAVRQWLAGRKPLLVLHGAPDGSKTTAAGLAIDLVLTRWLTSSSRAPSPRMLPAENLHRAHLYRDTSLDASRPREQLTHTNAAELQTSALVVVDDFGQEGTGISHLTIDAVEVLTTLRSNQGLRMLITTNLPTPQALFEHMGDRGRRFGERITEYGVFCECPVEGYRGGRGKVTT